MANHMGLGDASCVRGKPSVFKKPSLRWCNLDTAEAYNRANPADSGAESTQN